MKYKIRNFSYFVFHQISYLLPYRTRVLGKSARSSARALALDSRCALQTRPPQTNCRARRWAMLPPQPPTRPTGNHDQTAARRHTAIGTATRAIGVIGARASCVCLLNATARGARRTLHAQQMRRAPRDAEEPPPLAAGCAAASSTTRRDATPQCSSRASHSQTSRRIASMRWATRRARC